MSSSLNAKATEFKPKTCSSGSTSNVPALNASANEFTPTPSSEFGQGSGQQQPQSAASPAMGSIPYGPVPAAPYQTAFAAGYPGYSVSAYPYQIPGYPAGVVPMYPSNVYGASGFPMMGPGGGGGRLPHGGSHRHGRQGGRGARGEGRQANSNRQDGGTNSSVSVNNESNSSNTPPNEAENGDGSGADVTEGSGAEAETETETETETSTDKADAKEAEEVVVVPEDPKVPEEPVEESTATSEAVPETEGIVFGSNEPVSVSITDHASTTKPVSTSAATESVTASVIEETVHSTATEDEAPIKVSPEAPVVVIPPTPGQLDTPPANKGTDVEDSPDDPTWEDSPYTKTLTLPQAPAPSEGSAANANTNGAPGSGSETGGKPVVAGPLSHPKPLHAGSHGLKTKNDVGGFRTPSSDAADKWRRSSASASASSTPDIPLVGGNIQKPSPTPWKRAATDNTKSSQPSSSPATETPSTALRYDKSTLLSIYVRGKTAPENIAKMYPELSKRERLPIPERLKPSHAHTHHSGPPSPHKGGRGDNSNHHHHRGGRHNNNHGSQCNHPPPSSSVEDIPHPDEEVIFSSSGKSDTAFRFDPARKRDMSLPENKLLRANEILNKLSIEKFGKLSKEFMNIGLDTEELLDGAVDLIVRKAQMEEHLSSMYANLCKTLTDNWSTIHSAQTEELGKLFRNLLLIRCETEFAQDREAAFERIRQMDISTDEKEEKTLLLKKSYTGHMRFIGEIYLLNLVRPKIMHLCIGELIESSEEEKLACMCKLLTIIGKQLEEYDATKKKKTTREYFTQIAKMVDDTNLSSRIRFAFKDLIELRSSGWVARRETEKAKSLSEFRTPDSSQGGASEKLSVTTPKHKGSQDVRALEVKPTTIISTDNEWSVVSNSSKKKNANKSTSVTSGGSGVGAGAGAGRNVSTGGNVFSALSHTKKEKSHKDKDRERDKNHNNKEKEKKSKKSTGSSINHSNNSLTSLSKSLSKEDTVETEIETENISKNIGLSIDVDIEQASDGPYSASEPIKEETGHGAKIFKKVTASVDEWARNMIEKDLVTDFHESYRASDMEEAVKCIFMYAMDSKDTVRNKICQLLTIVCRENIIHSKQMDSGLAAFLDTFDDVIVDAPLAESYLSSMFGGLLADGIIRLSVLTNLPEDNMFAMSPRLPHLVAKSLSAMRKTAAAQGGGGVTAGEAAAKDMLLGTGFIFADKIFPGPKQSQEEAVKELLETDDALFLL